MKRLFAYLMLLAATLCMTGPASAVVVNGSTYSIYLQGEASGNAALPISIFDDTPATFERAGLLVTVSESDTALTGVSNRISINLSANGDLFPVFNEAAFLGVGTLGDVLDLAYPVTLYDARVTVLDLAGKVLFASDNLVNFATVNAPWDGSFPSPSTTLSIDEIGGMGAANISFDFFVNHDIQTEVPEPGSVLLCGAGLLAAFAARRRRQSRI
jgi:hypothetical protein